MNNVILTSSFSTVAQELFEKALLPPSARVGFVPIASEIYDTAPWQVDDRKMLEEIGYEVVDINIKGKDSEQLLPEFNTIDIVFVAGGNVTFLSYHALQSHFSEVVKHILQRGGIYVGSSAGSILAGPSVEPFVMEEMLELPKDFVLQSTSTIGLVDYIVLPHHAGREEAHADMQEKFRSAYQFVTLEDDEYRIESFK